MKKPVAPIVLAALVILGPMSAFAQNAGGSPTATAVSSESLARALLGVTARLGSNGSYDDYLNGFIAEITLSGGAQSVVFGAIDKIVSLPTLSDAAKQALATLRRQTALRRDFTSATGAAGGGGIGGPSFGAAGGSDYQQ